eukprot:CAMPEP_0168740490 /NCGR_PEP_ID=MMETSP0724-20121128/12013_1 /TAXON_ID=265536 /ORGANISM="Amphiprora sp., Strain CCMP467" /LENGTH=478 /DNA_ID=CAMNT_0008787941 /DNA_START=183 /DNA_END=1619 /DNA_ORIENTATION=-
MTRTTLDDHATDASVACCWHPLLCQSSTNNNRTSENTTCQPNKSSNNCTVAGSVGIYWFFVSLIPVYNKFFFRKDLYPFPIATAGIQLAVVAVFLAVWNVAQHYQQQTTTGACRNHSYRQLQLGQQAESDDVSSPRSWILGSHLLFKLKWCFPIGFLFGLKYGVTNWGLHLVPAPTHLLLQSTDLVWTVLGAWWINQERIRPLESVCLLGCIVGSFVLSWNHIMKQHEEQQLLHDAGTDSSMTTEDDSLSNALGAPLFAIGINLLSPMLLGLCLSTLRLACTELMRSDNCLRGTVTSVELTSIKLFMSSTVATLLAMLLEPGWWQAFCDLEASTRYGVLCGAVLIACFQVNCTYLTHLTNTVSVGLVGQVKIIPQWIVATIFATEISKDFHLQTQNVVGAILICVSAAAFCWSSTHHPPNNNNNTTGEDCDTAIGTDDDSSNDSNDPKDIDPEIMVTTTPLLLKKQTSTVSSGYLSIS